MIGNDIYNNPLALKRRERGSELLLEEVATLSLSSVASESQVLWGNLPPLSMMGNDCNMTVGNIFTVLANNPRSTGEKGSSPVA